ncbi:MAG: hypothetical protein AW10_04228 [Candidatus Accumulibacter appositus]|uniref:Uncharacterized protein n=1 Tax=Candidatus Accumulibacter appositus TaxID=1454003 RepID=A0A011NHA3_9PROT|nr:MAG: hypothetical protein AW10_04228 [Candidatus Accumulibacter appositus]
MHIARSTYLQAVWLVRPVRNNVDAELSLGMLDRRVRLAFRHMHAFRAQLEVVNQLLHVGFHGFTIGRCNLVVVGHHRTRVLPQPVDALLENAIRLAHLFHAHQIAIIGVAGLADRDVEIDPIIDLVRLFLAQVPGNTRAAQHRTGKTTLQGALRRHDGHIDKALLPNPVIGEQRFVLVEQLRKTAGEIVEEIEKRTAARLVERLDLRSALPLRLLIIGHTIRQIAVDAARPVVGRMHACTGNRFVGIDQVFALAKGVEHHGHRADVETMTADPQQVIQDARDFVEHDPDVLRPDRHLDLQQALDGHAIGVLVAHHRHVVETVHVRHRLNPGLRFSELLGCPMEQTDMRVGTHDDFAVKLQNHPQHTVRCRVLRPEVQSKVAQFRHFRRSRRSLRERSAA